MSRNSYSSKVTKILCARIVGRIYCSESELRGAFSGSCAPYVTYSAWVLWSQNITFPSAIVIQHSIFCCELARGRSHERLPGGCGTHSMPGVDPFHPELLAPPTLYVVPFPDLSVCESDSMCTPIPILPCDRIIVCS